MGDMIELTTYPQQLGKFFKISSGALMFDVKASGYLGIGLSSKPSYTCDVWIGIGCESNFSWISQHSKNDCLSDLPNILSSTEYRSFWIAWNNCSVRFGKAGNTDPLLSYKNNKLGLLNYVTFSIIHGGRYPAYWRFELPPLFQTPLLQPITGGTLKWVPATTQLPDGALIGGYEQETLYIIRAPHQGSLTPGKFVPSEGLGYLAWGGAAHEKSDFEVLCGFNCTWVPCSLDKIPVGAVDAGHSEVAHERLFVGRAKHEGHFIPGKVQPSHRVIYIPYDGREIAKESYEILVVPEDNDWRCAHKRYMHLSQNIPDIAYDMTVRRNIEMY